MKLREEMKHFRKEIVFDNYTRVIEHFKDYEKISKVKMLDEIYQLYDEVENIIDICTGCELRYLKKLLDNEEECQDWNKYLFEIDHLSHKYLVLTYPNIHIPEEICDKVRLALEQVDWKVVEEKDKINEVLVGICRVYGKIEASILLELGSSLLNLDKNILNEHIIYNRAFKYFVYFCCEYNETLKRELPMFIYQDYYQIIDELEIARREFCFACTREVCLEDYIHIFYCGFNINREHVKKFYEVLKESSYYRLFLDFVLETVLLNGNRENLYDFMKRFFGEDKNFWELMNQGLDEMPSGALNGATPLEMKYARLEQEKNRFQKEVQYLKQVDAKLTRREEKIFYQIYFALLEFTNLKYKVDLNLKKIYKQTGLNPSDLIGIIEKFWEEKEEIVDEFLEKNPYHFGKYELDLTEGFKRGIRGLFVLARFEENYTCLIREDKCYMIKGIHANLDEIISYQSLPVMVITAILPFGRQIIFDGILQTMSGISMGAGFETLVNEELGKKEKVYQL